MSAETQEKKTVASRVKAAAARVRGRKKTDEPSATPRPIEGVGTSTAGRKFSNERLMTILLAPVISEKATLIADKHQQVIFEVAPDATKPEVKAAVELLFSKKDKPIEVMSVQIANVGGKKKRRGRWIGTRPDTKRAIVTLAAGEKIDLFEG